MGKLPQCNKRDGNNHQAFFVRNITDRIQGPPEDNRTMACGVKVRKDVLETSAYADPHEPAENGDLSAGGVGDGMVTYEHTSLATDRKDPPRPGPTVTPALAEIQ